MFLLIKQRERYLYIYINIHRHLVDARFMHIISWCYVTSYGYELTYINRYRYGYEIYRRKFRSRTSDLWTDAATVVRAVREEKRQKRERVRQETVSRKKIKGREKVEKSRFTVCFPNVLWLRSHLACSSRWKIGCATWASRSYIIANMLKETNNWVPQP